MVSVRHRRANEISRGGPGTVPTGAGLATHDVPEAGHKMGAEGDEDYELKDTKQDCSVGEGEGGGGRGEGEV